MGLLSSKIDYKLLEECENHVSQIDKLASSLAESVDSVHTTVGLLLKLNSETGYAVSRDNEVKVLKELLGNVERGLCSQKLAFLEALETFASFLSNTSDTKATIRALKHLSIDNYLKGFREKQTSLTKQNSETTIGFPTNDDSVLGKKLSMTFVQDKGLETLEGFHLENKHGLYNIKQFLEEREALIKTLKDTKEHLNDNNKKLTNEVYKLETLSHELTFKNKCLEDQNRNLSEELNMLKTSEIKQLEQALQERTRMISTIKTENESLKDLNSKLLEQLTPKTELIEVQIFMQRKGTLLSLIESDFLRLISKHPMFENKELKIVRPESSDEIKGNDPNLILCLHRASLETDAKREIQTIKEPGKTALLIFHYKEEHALPSQTSDGILTAAEFRALGGIFDLAFQNEKGIYECRMNNSAAEGIIKFILKSISK